MHRILTVAFVIYCLTGCDRTDAQANIRTWCADNPDICRMNAVK